MGAGRDASSQGVASASWETSCEQRPMSIRGRLERLLAYLSCRYTHTHTRTKNTTTSEFRVHQPFVILFISLACGQPTKPHLPARSCTQRSIKLSHALAYSYIHTEEDSLESNKCRSSRDFSEDGGKAYLRYKNAYRRRKDLYLTLTIINKNCIV